ncbi:MAG: MBL fold metallo-hydrolase [Candidatus Aenigmarchaeota archaeon]|nr:MBL fold metallo-hydrolase [Candidatus Aenigmarchaeota archaeon]
MAEVKILAEGYAVKIKRGWIASSTCTLIKDGKTKIVADPGANKKLLISRLKKEKLKPSDINYIFLTHYHLDHILQASLFAKAKILDGSTIYEDDKEFEYSGEIPGTSISVMKTPGHADEHCSLVVKTEKGKVVVAGDNFWWTRGEKQTLDVNREDIFANNMEKLKESRKKILNIADYIIPGHGKMLKVR